jgi:putative FmdB family regulatory protein
MSATEPQQFQTLDSFRELVSLRTEVAMPIYEYDCPKCGRFEKTQRITSAALRSCERCGHKVQRLISNTTFALKGTGWYATDYASSSSAARARALRPAGSKPSA